MLPPTLDHQAAAKLVSHSLLVAGPGHELGGERFGSYGYGWQTFYAGGNSRNHIIGISELDLVIVFMASNYNQSVQHETKYDYVPGYILTSVLEGGQ